MLSRRATRLAIVLAAATSLVLGLWELSSSGRKPSLRPGTEVFAVDPDLVLEVSYRQGPVRMTAHRRQQGAPFILTFGEQGRSRPSSCLAGPGFAKVLKELTSLKLQRTLTAREEEEFFRSKPLSSWGELVIRDTSTLAPFRARVLPAPGPAAGTLVHFQGITYLVALQGEVFNLISGGCKALGIPDGPPVRR